MAPRASQVVAETSAELRLLGALSRAREMHTPPSGSHRDLQRGVGASGRAGGRASNASARINANAAAADVAGELASSIATSAAGATALDSAPLASASTATDSTAAAGCASGLPGRELGEVRPSVAGAGCGSGADADEDTSSPKSSATCQMEDTSSPKSSAGVAALARAASLKEEAAKATRLREGAARLRETWAILPAGAGAGSAVVVVADHCGETLPQPRPSPPPRAASGGVASRPYPF